MSRSLGANEALSFMFYVFYFLEDPLMISWSSPEDAQIASDFVAKTNKRKLV